MNIFIIEGSISGQYCHHAILCSWALIENQNQETVSSNNSQYIMNIFRTRKYILKYCPSLSASGHVWLCNALWMWHVLSICAWCLAGSEQAFSHHPESSLSHIHTLKEIASLTSCDRACNARIALLVSEWLAKAGKPGELCKLLLLPFKELFKALLSFRWIYTFDWTMLLYSR